MATWKKLVVSGSNISQLNNDAQYISASQVPAAANAFSTASFNGTDLLADSNQGTLNFASGSTGLNIVATAGSDTLTFDLVAVPNSSLANDGITIAGQDISLGGSITADTIAGQISNDTITNAQLANESITFGTDVVNLGDTVTQLDVTGITGSLSATSVLADGVTATTQTSGDNSTKVATTEYVDAQVGGATLTISSSDGAGSSIAIDLNDEDLTLTGNDGLEFNLAGNDAGIGIEDGGILPVKLDSTLAGDGLTSTAGVLSLTNDTISGISLGSDLADLTVDDSSLELSSGTTYNGGTAQTINVKALGITNAMLAGNIANAKLVNDSITIGNATVALGGSTTLAATKFNSGSFSGSFQGDGSNLTGLVSTLSTEGDSGTGTIDLQTQTLDIAGGTNITTTAGAQTITVALNDNISVTDATVTGDLTVLGTASFQHETNLEVADRFILLASGSSATGDGGIIVQQATQDVGEVFGFDGVTGTERWGIGQAQNAASSSFTPEAFMAAVLTGNASSDSAIDALVDARYQAKGNLFIGDDQDIWIWS